MHPTSSARAYTAPPVTDLIRQARQGVLRRRVDEVARLVGLTDKEMARVLNMSVRGLHGKADSELLTSAASERLLLLERLVLHGMAVFNGQADLLNRWLRTPLTELSYREGNDDPIKSGTPLSMQTMGNFTESLQPPAYVSELVETYTSSAVVAQSPLSVLDTVSGFLLAEDVLGRIEWGIVG